MKHIPQLFNADMARAIWNGTKTETRRPITGVPNEATSWWREVATKFLRFNDAAKNPYPNHFGTRTQVGDLIYVREAWAVGRPHDGTKPSDLNRNLYPRGINYPATDLSRGVKRRPSLHMPKWASRMTLRVTDVSFERVQDIRGHDCVAEGIPVVNHCFGETRDAFASLWDSIYCADQSWEANPWVMVVKFETIKKNILEVGV